MASKPMTPWETTKDSRILRRAGKLIEELGELSSVAGRIIIQPLDEVDPGSGKTNRQRLTEEIADVQAQVGLTVLLFDLDQVAIQVRVAEKIRQMEEWEAFLQGGPVPSPLGGG